ncbi:histidine kinase [Algoriphagus halophytocola]|uniref:Histidine kinase n=1 Tax=Algoriphagus halophytocola TaxID=2991499 RepID=A0ABY6MNZ0_9BACT|nr:MULTISPECIES: histidine kinase [unclassified Algoriphagus]UZD23919.1 histidine kinase [Algoriphagus sp. TR-M5]WBL41287.1 histidine kinase [Algoriphagus sp. TR-M9]
MKSILTPPEIQFSGTNPRIKWINDKMRPFLAHPILILLCLWGAYILLDGSTTYYFELPTPGFVYAFITTIIGFFSSCLYFFWLFPSVFYAKKPWRIISLSLLGISVLSGLKYLLFLLAGIQTHTLLDFFFYELMRQWVFLVVTFTVWGFYALIKALQAKQRTEASFDRLRIVHNKGQLSPHFTLNLIGDISAKSLHFSPELFEDINHFITILRYAYIDTENFNSLSAEVQAILAYLHGQKLRFENAIYIQDEIDRQLLDYEGLYMPKLLLITLIENVFKHGIFQDPTCPVLIEAKMVYGKSPVPILSFSTQNKINKDLKLSKGKFGLETVRNLLDYFFDSATLTPTVTEDTFSLTLTIPYEESNQTWPNR